MLLDYPSKRNVLLNIPSYGELSADEVWKGRIRLHESVQSYISEIDELEDDLTLLTIRDNRFRFMSNQNSEDHPQTASLSNQNGKQLSGIFIWLHGEKLENWMDCSAVHTRRSGKKGLLGKEDFISAKGFVLTPSELKEGAEFSNTMFGLRIQGAADRDFKVERKGIVSFCVASQVQSLDSRIQGTSSRTYIVISSDKDPFIAYVRRSQGIKKLICDSENIKEMAVEPKNEAPIMDPTIEDTDDLFQLRLKLLKGDITKEQFELKRSKLQSA